MYLLFAGDSYYPRGGWEDYEGTFVTEQAAMAHLASVCCDWWHIVANGEIIRTGYEC